MISFRLIHVDIARGGDLIRVRSPTIGNPRTNLFIPNLSTFETQSEVKEREKKKIPSCSLPDAIVNMPKMRPAKLEKGEIRRCAEISDKEKQEMESGRK